MINHVSSSTTHIAPHVNVSNLEGKGPIKPLVIDLDQSLDKSNYNTSPRKGKDLLNRSRSEKPKAHVLTHNPIIGLRFYLKKPANFQQ